jgi:acid stress-induced BolA-like protein IbaG/YrbA
MSMTPETIQQLIQRNLPCHHLEVKGDGHHFYAIIVSQHFNGLTRIRRHQTVYTALEGGMEQAIHALSMQTFTPEEWDARRA